MDVIVYGPLRSATGTERVEIDFDGKTVEDALDSFVESYPRADAQIYADDGTLRPSVRVMRDGDRLEPGAPCSNGDELTLFPAIQGG